MHAKDPAAAGHGEIAFNPGLGPRGVFVAVTIGEGVVMVDNHGYGIWTEPA
jgi:hypothetical protein